MDPLRPQQRRLLARRAHDAADDPLYAAADNGWGFTLRYFVLRLTSPLGFTAVLAVVGRSLGWV